MQQRCDESLQQLAAAAQVLQADATLELFLSVFVAAHRMAKQG
jgi:hypothetical protein